jgi:hypothetical protein
MYITRFVLAIATKYRAKRYSVGTSQIELNHWIFYFSTYY